jgi:hypothetical protein
MARLLSTGAKLNHCQPTLVAAAAINMLTLANDELLEPPLDDSISFARPSNADQANIYSLHSADRDLTDDRQK